MAYKKGSFRIGFALTESQLQKLQEYMRINDITAYSKAFLCLLQNASCDVVTLPKSEFQEMFSTLQLAKSYLKDCVDLIEVKRNDVN